MSLLQALDRSLDYWEKARSSREYDREWSGPAGTALTPGVIYDSLLLFREILIGPSNGAEWERKVRERFTFWRLKLEGKSNPILLTGYYEPQLEGNLLPGGEYRYPLYRRPADLIELESPGGKKAVRMENGQPVPYYSRREIDGQRVLQGKGYELLWLKDPWECYVLHVQGSGKIRLPDGQIVRVGFAASNGLPYRSIGRVLVERGFLPESELSLQKVKEFLRQYPSLGEEILQENERYVFFRALSETEGPIGALGVPLTAGRSIATDLSIFPRGTLAYLASSMPIAGPDGKCLGRKKMRRFVLNQDTGAAMKGPERVDLFMGSGEGAGEVAGLMKEEGEIYFLLPRKFPP